MKKSKLNLKAIIFLVFYTSLSAIASAAQLTIDLPEVSYLLPPVSPPITQKEGLFFPYEVPVTTVLVPLFGENKYDEALAVLEEGYPDAINALKNNMSIAEFPEYRGNSSALYYFIGHTYFTIEDYDVAETSFKMALLITPDYIRTHESLGILYLVNERYDEARTHLARAAELGLNTAAFYGALGYLNHETNNPWGAVSAYQQALMLDHDNSQFQQGLLNSLSQAHQYESAMALIDQLLQDNQSDPELWVYRAHMALQLDDDEIALSSLETAIRLGDEALSNMQISALLHMRIGSVSRATELMEKGIVDGMDFVFIDQAVSWLITNDEWRLAQRLVEIARSRYDEFFNDEKSQLLTRDAAINLNDGDQNLAQQLLDEALNLDAGNAEALMALANIHMNKNNYNQAELLYERASVYPLHRENALISMAQLAIDQDRLEQALSLLRRVVNINPARVDLSRNIEILENLILIQ